MTIIKSNHGGLGGSGAPGGALASFYSHTIDQSLRFNRGDGAQLTRTPSSAGNRATWTWSAWVKRSGVGTIQQLFCSTAGDYNLRFNTDDTIIFEGHFGTNTSAAVFRDVSAWYNIVAVHDTTESTSSDRFKLYVNGTQQTVSGAYPSGDGVINSTTEHGIGGQGTHYFDGYMAEVNFIDGTALTPTSFGETKDGVWIPKSYSGSHGTNGFFLPFDDSSAIGDDESANTNDFTPSNLATTDVVPDSPTNNFATMNSIYHSASQAVLLEGNLKADTAGFSTAAHGYGAVSTFAIPKDKKIYIEVECTDGTGDNWFAGFAAQSGLESGPSSTTVGGSNAITTYNRSVYINGSETDYGASAGLGGLGVAKLASGDILGCMCDGATGKVWFSRNGTFFKSPSSNDSGTTGDPAGGNHEIGTITNGTTEDVFFVLGGNTSVSSIFVNFGQDSVNVASANADGEGIGTFEYAPPTDYLALCTSNLSDPAISPGQSSQADDYFNIVLYTGNGSTQNITGVGFQADWTWIKNRSAADAHALTDSVRGVTKELQSNAAAAESTNADGLTAFGADGFSLGDDDIYNTNTESYVSWNWKGGGNSNTFNVDGTGYGSASDASLSGGNVTPTGASVNTTAGFSIIGYTGNGSANQTIKHGLSSAPEFIIIKDRDANSNNDQWQIIHTGVGDDYGYFTTDGFAGTGQMIPTSGDDTTVTIGRDATALTNESGDDFIMYCFHSVEGYSKFDKYVGNGNADGTFVHTGFRPAWLIIKRSSGSGGWHMFDNKRSTFNEIDVRIEADNTDAENTSGPPHMDFLSNGFKMKTTFDNMNASGSTYIYFAFAEAPFKFANAR